MASMKHLFNTIVAYTFALAFALASTFLGHGWAQKIVAFLLFLPVGAVVGFGLITSRASRNETVKIVSLWIAGLFVVFVVGMIIAHTSFWLGVR
ncbi:hypothetical protein NKY39_15985 [Sinorhizobium meliloti]|uniref:hypothetical protein n=1 Tax=Rhizobium meliloti TaxID=382 RepID=UPI003D657817